MTLFNRNGEAIAYIKDNGAIYSFEGEPVAFIKDNSVFNYQAKFLGWFVDFSIRDRENKLVFFTKETSNVYLILPVTRIEPVKRIEIIEPIRPCVPITPVRGIQNNTWSSYSNLDYFRQ